jgi:hypothetical protein
MAAAMVSLMVEQLTSLREWFLPDRPDADLVRDAKAARQRLIESQHAAEQAKADYHHAIRRLHAAGGSLREIAEALRLSHQRVHQIIDEAPEPTRPWWRRRGRRWRGPPGPCSFCGRSRQECAKLIAGPGVFICERCVAQATRLSAGSVVEGWAEGSMRLEASRSEARCSFCGKQARQVGFLGRCCVLAAHCMLKPRPRPLSDRRSQLVERNRHPPAPRLLHRQLVVTAPNVLHERMAGDHDPGAMVLLEPTHRP